MGRPDGRRRADRAGEAPPGGDPRRGARQGLRPARRAARRVVHASRAAGFSPCSVPTAPARRPRCACVATLLRPSSGSVAVAGHDLRDDPTPVRRAIGFISHNPLLYRDLTAQENLRFYADMYGVADAGRRIGDLLERVELSHRRYDVVSTFSKGMLQRLAIARALLHEPRVLLLDEPHSGLDPHAVDILDGLLDEIRAEHTFVMATHNLRQGLELADQVMILDARPGRLSPDRPARRRPTSPPSTASTCAKGRWSRHGPAPVQGHAAQGHRLRAAHPRDGRLDVPVRGAGHDRLSLRLHGARRRRALASSPAACSGWCSSSAPCSGSTARSPTKRTRAASTACCSARSTE